MKRLWTLVSALAIGLPAPCAFARTKAGPVLVHEGLCEASGAVPYPPGSFGDRFLVVNDEDNVLRLYRSEESGPALALDGADLGPAFGLGTGRDAPKADLEAATWLGDDLVVIRSHSRTDRGEAREPRRQVMAVSVAGASGALALTPKGRAFQRLAEAFSDLDPLFAERIALDVPKQADLSPKQRGFNIEGLAPGPDARSLLIGLRNPLDAERHAIVVPLENPAEVLAGGAAPRLGKPTGLDLEGRGIRDIAFAPQARTYLIVAGGTGRDEAFDLYRWSGEPGAAPVRVPGAAEILAAIPHFQPEGLLLAPDASRARLLSDDGGGCTDDKPQRFRSILIELR
ncbi:DUF3616 domain-containing protein [Methylobacterium sp. ID0610]|uniref:DUF3616 domain-containing protein n=1 Tax=Methylobacterium carpenticola TaxID=3344827 RepID=UPI00367B1642